MIKSCSATSKLETKQQIMNDEFKKQTLKNCDDAVNDIFNLNTHF